MINSKMAERRRKDLKRFWSHESQLTQEILIAILWHLENPTKKLRNQIRGLRSYITRLKNSSGNVGS